MLWRIADFFQQALRFRAGAVASRDLVGWRVDLAHPAVNETAFAGRGIVELAGQRRGNAAATARGP